MLNLAEHWICPAKKTHFTNNCKFFLPNIAEHENFSANKYENVNYSVELSMKKSFNNLWVWNIFSYLKKKKKKHVEGTH